jgi:hypothetical protein
MSYDPSVKFTQPMDGIVLVGVSPTDAEIAEAHARISSGEDSFDVWEDIDARCATRMRQRQAAGDTDPRTE